jgi:hypothetical protein
LFGVGTEGVRVAILQAVNPSTRMMIDDKAILVGIHAILFSYKKGLTDYKSVFLTPSEKPPNCNINENIGL